MADSVPPHSLHEIAATGTHHRSDTAKLPSQVSFFMLGNRKKNGAKSEEYWEWSTSSKQQSRTGAQQPLQPPTCDVQEHCPGEIKRPSSVFQAVWKCLYSITFQSRELLIYCGFIWNEIMQLVSGNVEFNASQISLLWHNSLVSLWTFQHTLVN